MGSEELFRVDVAQLEPGLPLRFDLQTKAGLSLASAGTIVTAELKENWIRKGFSTAYTKDDPKLKITDPTLQPYDPKLVKLLEHHLDRSVDTILQTNDQLAQGITPKYSELRGMVDDIVTDIESDVAVVLGSFLGRSTADMSSADRVFARRSTQMSILSMVVAVELGLSADDRQTVGVAGMLHDVGLYECMVGQVKTLSDKQHFADPYFNHPVISSMLVEPMLRASPRACHVVSQVHEQPNGGGFPKGIQQSRISPLARVLSVADAYLTMTTKWQPAPLPDGKNLHPSDAIACLMFHAAKGRFDTDVVKALVRVMSLYPIGCQVLLSNKSVGVVLRSTPDSPTKPIVRVHQGRSAIIDLTKSQLTIVQPVTDAEAAQNRIDKSQIGEILWR
jgi:HD-GYP domain-containing protein (c-di-GMP phosphodiesterase class II)